MARRSAGKTSTKTDPSIHGPETALRTGRCKWPTEGALIWVGPPITYLRFGETFAASKRPKFLDAYAERCPAVRMLFVGAGDFVRARDEARRSGTQLNLAYGQVVKEFLGN